MLDNLIFRLLRYLVNAGTVSFFGVGMGPSGEEKQAYGEMSNLGKFGIGHGEKDISQAENFWSSILSGDPSQISKVLGPQISAVNKQTQEQKKTASEFGNRGGGTNAAMQSLDDRSIAAVRSMISNLTGEAGGALGSLGGGLLSTGAAATGEAFGQAKTMQEQNQAKWNDIFQSIAAVAGVAGGFFPAAGALGKVGQGLTGAAGVLQSGG